MGNDNIQNAKSAFELVSNTISSLRSEAKTLRSDLKNVISNINRISSTVSEFNPPKIEVPKLNTQGISQDINKISQRIRNIGNQLKTFSNDLNKFSTSVEQMLRQVNQRDLESFFSNILRGLEQHLSLRLPFPPHPPNFWYPAEPLDFHTPPPQPPDIGVEPPPENPGAPEMPDKPNLFNIDIPPVPQINLPEVPTLNDIPLPNSPDLSNIKLDNYTEENYDEKFPNLPEDIQALMNGGDSADLSKLERSMLERIYQELTDFYNQEIDTLKSRAEKLGYMLPPGIYLKEMRKVRTEMLRRRSEAFSKLQTALSEFHNKNRQLGVSAATDIEKMYISLHDNKQERRLKYYLAQVDTALKDFDSKLKAVMSYYETLKNKVILFQELLDAEKMKMEIYKTQLEGQKIVSELNNSLIEEYKAELKAIETKLNVYESQIRAYSTKVQAALSKVEIYKAQVSAYAATIEAKKIDVDIYKAKMDALESRVRIYESQIKGYIAAVQAESLKLESQKSILQSKIDIANARVNIFRTKAEVMSKALMLKRDLYSFVLESRKAMATLTEVLTKAIIESIKAKTSLWNTKVEATFKKFDADIKKGLSDLDIHLKKNEVSVEILRSVASLTNTLAAAYINAINVGASASDNESTIVQA